MFKFLPVSHVCSSAWCGPPGISMCWPHPWTACMSQALVYLKYPLKSRWKPVYIQLVYLSPQRDSSLLSSPFLDWPAILPLFSQLMPFVTGFSPIGGFPCSSIPTAWLCISPLYLSPRPHEFPMKSQWKLQLCLYFCNLYTWRGPKTRTSLKNWYQQEANPIRSSSILAWQQSCWCQY